MVRLQVIIAAVCFGTTGTAQALGPSVAPAAVGATRIAVGAILLALIAGLASRRREDRSLRRVATLSGSEVPRERLRSAAGTVLVGGACVALYQLTFFAAVADTGVAVGTVVAIGSAPAFTGIIDRLTGGPGLSRRWVGATALACAGVALLVLGGGADAQVRPGGVALAAIAGAGYASYAVASKRLMQRGHGPESVMAAVFGTGAVLVAPVLLVVPAGALLAPGGIALALYLGVIPTALAYVLFARGLREIDASEVTTLALAEPLTASVLGVAVLGERPGAIAVLGAVLVLAGLFLVAMRPAVAPSGAPIPSTR
jgi:DME family drug/metabolite transporter